METLIRRGPPLRPLVLSADERSALEAIVRRRTSAQQAALRARIVLCSADGLSNSEVARELGINRQTCRKWRDRFVEHRLEGLLDEPRPGAPRTVSDAAVEEVVTRTLESVPRGQTHWSRTTMAQATGISESSVGRIWRAFGLKPHRVDSFKLSPDPLFIDKVRDIVGLYLSPPENAIVLCVDEKSQIQALDRTQPILPMRPGQPERHTHDYDRHGVTSLFAALDAQRGEVIHKTYRKHRHQEFLRFLAHIEKNVPADIPVHLVLDNYATHKTPAVKRWFEKRPRFHVHFTPTYSSWINMVERLFAEVTDKAIRRGAFRSVRELEGAIDEYMKSRDVRPFQWVKSADEILASVSRFCLRISDGGH